MKKLFILIGLVSTFVAKAQSDTYFVLPPLYEWEGGDHDVYLYISTSSPTSSVWVYNSDTSLSQTIIVTSNAIGTITFSSPVVGLNSTYGARELNWTNQKRYKDALFVEATNPVTITQRIVDTYNQEIITAKGRNALGKEFYVASQTLIHSTVSGSYAGYKGMHYISVVATEDSTNIKFKAPANNYFDNGLDSVVFNLDAGQSWVSKMQDDDVLLGTHIMSNKPIAVTAGGNHLKSASAGNADAGIDQVTPIEHLGTKHVVLRGMANHPNDYFMYIATEDSTYITVDGTSILTNGGPGDAGTHSMTGNANTPGKPCIIESTRPIYVFQVTTGTTSHDPEQGMAQIPHVDCTGSTFIRYNRASGLATSALVTIPSSAVSSLNYNGNPVIGNTGITVQQSTYDPSWSGVYIGPNTLTNNFTLDCINPFHVGILAGQGTSTGLYGYISGFDDDLKLLDPFYAQPVTNVPLGALCATPISLYFGYISCVDSITVLSHTLMTGTGTVVDSNARDTILHAIIDPTYSGPVKIKVVVEDDRGSTDSIYFDFNYYGTIYEPITDDSTSVCLSQPTTVEVNNPTDGLSYNWSNGDTTSSTSTNQSGWLWVLVDLGDCQFTDSIYLKNGSLFEPPYRDTAFCDSMVVDFSSPILTDLYWTTLDTHTAIIQLDSTAWYPYEATDINGCVSQDSLYFRLRQEPYVDEGYGCPNYTLKAYGYTAFISLELGGATYMQPSLDTLFPFAGIHELTLVAIDSCNNLDTIHSVLEVDCLDDVLMYVPTAFTPNGDGVNDQYCISSSLPERTSYAIYDRWGNELFSGPSTQCWDPQAEGREVPTGSMTLRTFTRLPTGALHLDEYTIFSLP